MFIKGRWYNHSKKKKIPENELSQSFETDIDFFQICIIIKMSVELG